MGYRKAEDILPQEIIKLIQRYIDGESIYIPRKDSNKKMWGNGTQIRQELRERNLFIFTDFKQGYGVGDLAKKYFLSEKSIQRIIREMKKGT